MSRWRRIVSEVHRRSLAKVLGVYVVASWAGFEIVGTLYQTLGLPRWVPAFAAILFVIGLPIVVATAIVQEGPPGARRGSRQDDLLAGITLVDDDGAEVGSPATAGGVGGIRRRLTWRRSILGVVAAFAVLAVVTTGFMVARGRGSLLGQGLIDPNDALVLADFAGGGRDSSLAPVVTEAVRIDLLASRVIRLADPTTVKATLRRMQRDPATKLTDDVAVEIAERDGLKAVVIGDVSSLGGRYLLTARLVAAKDGSLLAAFRATARDSTGLLDAVDDLARQIRDRTGESLADIRATPPLSSVTTPSLPALRTYATASRLANMAGDPLGAVPLFEEAIALDSTFAMAWVGLGTTLSNMNTRAADRDRALRRGYALRDRLTERERLLATGLYHTGVTHDWAAGADAYRRMLERDPDDRTALNNLGVVLLNMQRVPEAVAYYERSAALPDAPYLAFWNLADARLRLGQIEEARAAAERGLERLPGNPVLVSMLARLAAAEQRWDAVDSIEIRLAADHPDSRQARRASTVFRRGVATIQGRLGDAGRFTRSADVAATGPALAAVRLENALSDAELTLRVRGDAAGALRRLADALRQAPLDSLPAADRPYARLAELYADAGRFDAADSLVARSAREQPPLASDAWDPLDFTRAYVALRRGDPGPGLDVFRREPSFAYEGCETCYLPFLGQAWELAGQPDSARAAYERFLAGPSIYPLRMEPVWRPIVLQRVAALHEQAGDTARAVQRYAEFVRLWQHADPELRPRVEAARRRLRALGGAG